jgi:hypothetical protein
MNVEIHFTPDDGPLQVLYAVMTSEEFDKVNEIISSPSAEETVLRIPSRTGKDRPEHGWIFRASRIRLVEVP